MKIKCILATLFFFVFDVFNQHTGIASTGNAAFIAQSEVTRLTILSAYLYLAIAAIWSAATPGCRTWRAAAGGPAG